MSGNSSLKYLLVIVAFAVGMIGMLFAFTLNPLVGLAIFWLLMAVCGYVLYRMLTEDA